MAFYSLPVHHSVYKTFQHSSVQGKFHVQFHTIHLMLPRNTTIRYNPPVTHSEPLYTISNTTWKAFEKSVFCFFLSVWLFLTIRVVRNVYALEWPLTAHTRTAYHTPLNHRQIMWSLRVFFCPSDVEVKWSSTLITSSTDAIFFLWWIWSSPTCVSAVHRLLRTVSLKINKSKQTKKKQKNIKLIFLIKLRQQILQLPHLLRSLCQ